MDRLKQVSAFEMYKQGRNQIQLASTIKSQKKKKKVKRLEKASVKSHSATHNIKMKLNPPKIQVSKLDVVPNKKLKKAKKLHNTKQLICTNGTSESPLAENEENRLIKSPSAVQKMTEASTDPITESEKLFEWLIYPLSREDFFKRSWEKTPLHIKRKKAKYYRSLMSTPLLDHILRDNHILFTKNIDITSFSDDVRETHNPPGRALPSIVWDYFANGCSVRMLNPQTYISKLHTLNATLQELFGCFVGSNSYLTPANSQGFAPHYDDIEAFILQIEGKKRWRLYKPRTNDEVLPRFSSPNFSQSEIGEPILDTVVEAGDLLYFPRGTIHQGDTFGFDQHSLHITLSVYQKNSWGDFFEKLLPAALKSAIEKNVQFRKGLPLEYLRHIGCAYDKNSSGSIRQEFLNQTKTLFSTLLQHLDIDGAADEMAKGHIHDFLPPVLGEHESLCSVYEGGERMVRDGRIVNRVEIEPDTFVRLSRAHCARLVEENGAHRLFYSCDNSKEYHEYEPQFLEVDPEFVPVLKELIVSFPAYVRVEDLPIQDLDKKIQIVRDLWEKAIVVSEEPLPIVED